MEKLPRKYLLLHPAVVPAKWLELADILTDMDTAAAHEVVEGAQARAWWAGWSDVRPPNTYVRVLGSPPPADFDALCIDDTLHRAYNRGTDTHQSTPSRHSHTVV
jgi:hypothetical protein